MHEIRLPWDERKYAENNRKHGVSFHEARTVVCNAMTDNYDFSRAKRNPYAKHLKRQVTIRLDLDTLEYFKALAADSRIPYQTLINLYLRECAASRKRLVFR